MPEQLERGGLRAFPIKMRPRAATCVVVSLTLVLGASTGTQAVADPIAEFYTGKTIRMIIRSGVGGGYDQYSRLLGRHIGKHIPGNPHVLPVNMPGGGGIVAANYVANVAPRDGTILTIVSQGLVVDQALGLNKTFKADLRSFGWVGNLSKSNQLTVAWHTSKTKTLKDAMTHETLIGATGAGSISTQLPAFYNNVLGTKFKIVHGYPDGSDVNMAMERNEVEGRGTNPWASYRAMTPRYVTDKMIVPLIQAGLKKEDDLPDVPLLLDVVKPEDRPLAEFMSKSVSVGRPIATTPGTPPERLQALRRAFDAALKDPDFIREAETQRAEIESMDGEELERIVHELIGAPQETLDRVKVALQPKDKDMSAAPKPAKAANGKPEAAKE
ncbi:MAG: tripartite tricarboxylate transporter family receptor [Hyphomicrobiales bacterium]|nr:tripartite tricarboxylate transporter family receptor [Hyphomicrobiales bacterium]